MSLLTGKVAFVSGGGSGIGRAVAETYAKEGAKVVIADINENHGAETVKAIKDAGGDAFFIKGDSSKAEDNKRFVEETVAKYGRLDIACNNAGIGGPALPTGEYPIDGWDKVIALNLSGVFYACLANIK